MDFALNRRSFLRGAAALGAAAAAGLTFETSAMAEETAPTTDRIVIGRRADSDDLDPVMCVGNNNIFIFNLIIEGLIMTSDDGNTIECCLAEDYEIDKDGLVYTFYVKPGLVFSDGTPVTKEDWQFTFDRAMQTTESNWYSSVSNIEKVECPDDTTVIVTLKSPTASTLANLCIFDLGVQSKAYFEKVGADEYKNCILGTGPFMVKEWKRGEYLTLAANPNYRDAGLPLAQEIEFKVVADDNARMIQLQGGDIDAATDLALSTLQQLEADPNVVPHPDPSTVTRFMAFNVENQYLSDIRVRQAINMATDPQQVVDMANYGYGTAIGTIFAPTSEYCNHNLPVNTPDIEGAKALLAEAGYPNGFPLSILIRGGDAFETQVATILQFQWSQIGVQVTIEEAESTSYKTRMYGMEFDTLIDYWSDDIQDPQPFMAFVFDFDLACGYDTNFRQPEEMVALNDQANLETDIEKRKEIYFKIQETFKEQAIFVPLMTTPWQNAVRADIVDFKQTPLGNYRFKTMTREA